MTSHYVTENASTFRAGWLEGEALKARKNVLVVSPNAAESSAIRDLLIQHGLSVSTTAWADGTEAMVLEQQIDLVVMDFGAQWEDQAAILETLSLLCPVVALAESQIGEAQRVDLLERGAEDVITKPFGRRELVARVRVCLRPRQLLERAYCVYTFADWTLNTRSRILRKGTGEHVELGATEFNLLIALLDQPGRTLSRDDLMRATRLHATTVGRSIDVLVVRLRRKIETGCGDRSIIRTMRGEGYALAVPVNAQRRRR